MRTFRDRLQDILEAIAQVEQEQAKGRAAFDTSPLIQVWMVHHLMIIGEAVRSIDHREMPHFSRLLWSLCPLWLILIAALRKTAG